jgi:hypothetical protein
MTHKPLSAEGLFKPETHSYLRVNVLHGSGQVRLSSALLQKKVTPVPDPGRSVDEQQLTQSGIFRTIHLLLTNSIGCFVCRNAAI